MKLPITEFTDEYCLQLHDYLRIKGQTLILHVKYLPILNFSDPRIEYSEYVTEDQMCFAEVDLAHKMGDITGITTMDSQGKIIQERLWRRQRDIEVMNFNSVTFHGIA